MSNKQYWFPRKSHGWGWGVPSCWQGWVSLLAYVASMITFRFFLFESILLYSGVGISLTLAFIGLCFWKGEPPKWQWGNKKK